VIAESIARSIAAGRDWQQRGLGQFTTSPVRNSGAAASRDARSLLRKPKSKPPDNHERIAQLRAEVGNIADAIASGMMRASKALASRLRAAESELEREEQAQALADAPTPSAERLLPALPAIFDRLVDNLDATLASGDLTRGREEIRSLVGCVTVKADADQISLFYERGNFAASMMKATGTHAILCGSGGVIANGGLPAIPLRRKAS